MKIVILAGPDQSSTILYNALKEKYEVVGVIMEEKENRMKFLKRRMKKLGLVTVVGQVLFQLVIVKLLDAFSRKRKEAIIAQNKFSLIPIDRSVLTEVDSVNNEAAIDELKNLQPNLVVVNGTRIISKKVLNSVNCKFINSHAGITPAYRGVHGAYWALANNDAANVGVTIHFIDAGIDTGQVIYQKRTAITGADSFVTYPMLQLADSIELLIKVIDDIFNNRVIIKPNNSASHLWSHPTIWGYLYGRVIKKIK